MKNILKNLLTALPLLLLLGCSAQSSQELVLVDKEESLAPIVLAENAPPFNRLAAEELADYMEKISGVRPEVLLGAPNPLPESTIWVGYQPALDDLFPETNFEFEHPEEILLTANDKHVVIAGRDRWSPELAEAEYPENLVPGLQQEYGTANAVYTFMQDQLGIRWIWPGEIGEDVPQKERIAIAPFTFRYHPQFISRAGILNYSRLGNGGYGTSHDWSRRQRLQLDSLRIGGGHGFGDWFSRFDESNPEFFALQPDGTRSGFPSPKTAKMCLSNPDVWDQWMKEVEKQLEENPQQTVFNASENDSWASGYCVCENCLAWDHPDGEKRMFRWKGLNQEHVAMSERQVKFANALGKKLKERYPDKDYYVLIMAYGHSRPAPIEAVPDSNVIVSSVANFFARPNLADNGSPQGTLHRDQFEAWGKVAPNIFWRPNQGRAMVAMPNIPIQKTIEDMRFVAENNCIGIYVDMIWENWATRGPLYYVMAQMAWNPWLNGDELMEDYYMRGFGNAAPAMREYWAFMEDQWTQSKQGEYEGFEPFEQEFFDKAYAILEQAAKAVENEPEVYGKRVNFVRVGLDYTRLVNESFVLMERFQETGDPKLEEAAAKIWNDEIHPMVTNPENKFAINWGPTRPGAGHSKKGPFPKGIPSPREWPKVW